ncbi:MAG TPA: outer membrane beta-barrel protein [Gemmatimonadaceae bacterium]|nr:outer membrane beta-barrel protein [Gemmatimonadaceae bacterium]
MAQLVAVVAGLAVATAAQAQKAPAREGFWFSGGLGMGSLGSQNGSQRENGLSGDISLGGTLSQRWLLGVGSSAWSKSEQGGRLTVATLDARVRFYPSATGGFFLTGGIGGASIRASVGNLTATDNGAGAIFGLGYDYRVARNASITPYWNGFAMKSNDNDANVGQIGLAITLH